MSASTDVSFGLDITDPSTYLATIRNVGFRALGTGTAAEQILANIIVIGFAIGSTSVGFALGIFVVLFALPFLGLGFLRLIPAVNARWPL